MLPRGWGDVSLGDLTVEGPTNGYSPRSTPNATGTLVLRLPATTQGRMILSPTTTKRLDEVIERGSPLWLRSGDLLIQRSNTPDRVGTAAVYEGPEHAYVYPDLMMRLRLRDAATTRWVWRFLNSSLGRNQVRRLAAGAAGNMPKINSEKVRGLRIPLPPPDEHRRLSEVLERGAAIVEKVSALRGTLTSVSNALFVERFGDPVATPKRWPTTRLGAVSADFSYGTSAKCGEGVGDGCLPVLRIPNVVGGSILWDDLKSAPLSKSEVARLDLQLDDMLLVRTNGNPNYIGRSALFDGTRRAVFASYLIRVRLSEAAPITPTFLHGLFQTESFRRELRRRARSTAGNYNISIGGLSELPVVVPPRDLQERFAHDLEQVDVVRDHGAQLQQEAQRLVSALTDSAFRGEL